MKRAVIGILALAAAFWLGLLASPDDNDQPVYGKFGPINCRAYVDVSIAGYRSKRYTADEAMAGLERNCGAAGQSWKNRRD